MKIRKQFKVAKTADNKTEIAKLTAGSDDRVSLHIGR